eukprot:3705080-Rhodomonas_salina.1
MRRSALQFQLGYREFKDFLADRLLTLPQQRSPPISEPERCLENWSQLNSTKRMRDEDDQAEIPQPNPKRPSIGFYDEKIGSWPRSDRSSMSQM